MRTGIGDVHIAGAVLGHRTRRSQVRVWTSGRPTHRSTARNAIDRVLRETIQRATAHKKEEHREKKDPSTSGGGITWTSFWIHRRKPHSRVRRLKAIGRRKLQ